MRLPTSKRLGLTLALLLSVALTHGVRPTLAVGVQTPPVATAPATVDQQSGSDKLALIREAFDLIYTGYVYPTPSSYLLADAWDGLNQAIVDQGLPAVARPPLTGAAEADWAAFAAAYRRVVTAAAAAGAATPTDLAYAAIRQMASGRNSCHTAFLPPEGNQNAAGAGRHQPTTDVGFVASRETNLVYRVYPGGPADRAGLRPGDTIISSAGQGDPFIRRRIFNTKAGRSIDIEVQRPGVAEPIAMTLAPEITVIPFIRTRVLPGGIGVIQWDEFTEGVGQTDAIRQAIADFAAQGVVGWVLDLRTSPGGDAHTMAAIGSLFLTQGLLATSIDRAGAVETIEIDSGAALPEQLPLVVLTLKFSASAADILPGALQDAGRAHVIGETTDGCIGSALLRTLADGSGLQVEVNRILVGNDRLDLNGVGITPDETIVWDAESLAAGRDPQLDRAAEYLLDQASHR